ncbi:hypothetical protein Daura_46315 [Dactylosporangium aurantiacum]|uniref:Cytoplasmic membrane protein n=1 Tax=Dactylosporangium aurantiacum TaxID=35754 RepID=A0A9Q9II73_9ACTN|nr:hypothetical protein [Dactylosporangium aurantiacum]MDG6108169.1 hypothetical protein [Dactylosporangium aurantiacum]UWZ53839.1 hypothetical protein Daura_46315 [Dactylosporangium aurantiacum]
MTTRRKIRVWLVLFLIGLVASGVTAFPLEHEVHWLRSLLDRSGAAPDALVAWIDRVDQGITETNDRYPFIMYGTDWLAFAHLVIAVAFWGPLRDPVRNIWVIEFGMIACVGVVPLALFAGPVRGIPGWWTVLDISFGVFGIVPLLVVRRLVKRLEREERQDDNQLAPEKALPTLGGRG